MNCQQYHEPLDGVGIRKSTTNGHINVPQTFPSREWCAAWCACASHHPDILQTVEGLSGYWKLNIKRDRVGPGAAWIIKVQEADPFVQLVDSSYEPYVRATVTTSYGVIKRLIEGELDPMMALLMRRIKIDGDFGDLKGLSTRVKPLISGFKRVPTVYVC